MRWLAHGGRERVQARRTSRINLGAREPRLLRRQVERLGAEQPDVVLQPVEVDPAPACRQRAGDRQHAGDLFGKGDDLRHAGRRAAAAKDRVRGQRWA